jgi:hypothetical protein
VREEGPIASPCYIRGPALRPAAPVARSRTQLRPAGPPAARRAFLLLFSLASQSGGCVKYCDVTQSAPFQTWRATAPASQPRRDALLLLACSLEDDCRREDRLIEWKSARW